MCTTLKNAFLFLASKIPWFNWYPVKNVNVVYPMTVVDLGEGPMGPLPIFDKRQKCFWVYTQKSPLSSRTGSATEWRKVLGKCFFFSATTTKKHVFLVIRFWKYFLLLNSPNAITKQSYRYCKSNSSIQIPDMFVILKHHCT